jgi:hypothetical protein
MINELQTEIAKLIKQVPGVKAVYEHPEAKSVGYPFVWIEWVNNESEVLTNVSDRITLTYKITMIQEKFEQLKGRKNAEITTKDRAWRIEKLFRDNNDLGSSSVLRVLPVSSVKSYDDNSTRIVLETTVRVQVTAPVSV